MAYPPSPLPTDATDGTSASDTTPTAVLTAAEVNATNAAVNDIVAELGSNPSGASATVGARLDGIEADVTALGSASIPDGSVSTAKLADGAVTAAKLAATAVTPGAYTAADITVDAQGRITSAANGAGGGVADGSVTTAKLAAGAVTAAKVAADVATQAELDAETAARTAAIAGLSATYATQAAALAARLPGRLTITPQVQSGPTVTDASAATITANFATVGAQDLTSYSALGCRMNLNATYGFVQGDINGKNQDETHFGFTLAGDTAEFQIRAYSAAAGQRYWIFVDGKPITATASTPTTVISAGASLYVKLVFGAVGNYDIKVYTQGYQFYELRVPIDQGISPCSPWPWTVGIVGDSWGASNSSSGYLTHDAFPRLVQLGLGSEIVQGCIAGSGYLKPGSTTQPYSDAARVAAMVYLKPDLLLITAGGNDAGSYTPAEVTAAATALYATYRTALPTTPIIVIGQFPNSFTNSTTQSFIDNAKAIRDAAVASPNVLGFVDPLGIADTGVLPAAYANATAYAVGDRVRYLGGYLECTEAHTGGATPSYRRWKQLSWFTGTGRAGATTGDGNRDTFLASDQGHPTLVGSRYLAQRIVAEVSRILREA